MVILEMEIVNVSTFSKLSNDILNTIVLILFRYIDMNAVPKS